MSWRDELRPASYKGVAFHVLQTSKTAARRLVTNQFPFKDVPSHQDLGDGLYTHKITGIILGEGYFTARDNLEKALNSQGVGQLVHPFKGNLNVVCKSYEVSENFKNGGMATFTMTFEESDENNKPQASTNTKAVVVNSSDDVISSVKSDFTREFNVESVTAFVKENAEESLNILNNSIGLATDKKSADQTKVAAFNLLKSKFGVSIPSLVQTPGQLAGDLTNLISSISDISPSKKAETASYQSIAKFSENLPPVIGQTTARLQEAKNQKALEDMVVRTALAKEAEAVSGVEFDNYTQATQIRDDLSGRIEQEMYKASDAGQNETFLSLGKLQVALVRDVTDRVINLPRVMNVKPSETEPALVIANRLYGDNLDIVETMANDIKQRNNVAHPGFIKGGESLEVLSNEA